MITTNCHSTVCLRSIRWIWLKRYLSSQVLALEENAPESLYPPVKPRFPPGKWGRMIDKNAWKWHDRGEEVLKTKTLSNRLELLAGKDPKGYWQIKPFLKKRHGLSGIQYLTKSRVCGSLPEVYSDMSNDIDDSKLKTAELLLKKLEVQNELVRNNKSNTFEDPEDLDSYCRSSYLRGLVTYFTSISASMNPQVARYQLSEGASVESAWHRWGFKYPDIRTTTKDEGGLRIQSIYNSDIMMRCEHPLTPILKSVDDALPEEKAGLIPEFTYSPSNIGFRSETVKPSWLPGFLPGDPCEFGALQIIDISEYLKNAEKPENFGEYPQIVEELVKACAVTTGFTWASAIAHYQGFSMFHDLTYPICVQTILNANDRFMLSVYQLNTLALYKDDQAPSGNMRENVCWVSPVAKLDDANVMKQLLAMFNYPIDADNPPLADRRPYLPDFPSPLVSTEPLITTRTPVPPEEPVVDEFWKV